MCMLTTYNNKNQWWARYHCILKGEVHEDLV